VHSPEECPRRRRGVRLTRGFPPFLVEMVATVGGPPGFQTMPAGDGEALRDVRHQAVEPALERGTVGDDRELAGQEPDGQTDGQWTRPS